MPSIILPSRWERPPDGLPEPDWDHPLLQGVLSIEAFNPAKIWRGSNTTTTGTGRTVVRDSTWGGLYLVNAGYQYRSPTWPRAQITDKFTSAFVYRYASHSTTSMFILGDIECPAAGSGYNWGHYRSFVSNTYAFYVKNAAAASVSASGIGDFTPGKTSAIVGVYDGANVFCAKDGVVSASAAQTGNVANTSANFNYALNMWGDKSYIAGTYYLHVLLNRPWSRAEAQDWSTNPWQVFRKSPRILYFDVPTTGTITGNLAATESGTDTAALSGNVLVKGALAATEGSDTAALTGDLLVQGALAATEGSDTAEFLGSGATPAITGTLAATEGSDTAAITGKVYVSGTLSAVEGGLDAFVATGNILVKGAMSASETGADIAAFTSAIPTHHILLRTGQVSINKPDASTAYDFNGAAVSLLAFSFASRGMSTGDTMSYYADDSEGNWERGVGTWDATAKTIARTTVRGSSTGSAIDWSGSTVAPTVWSDGYQPEDSIAIGSTEAYYLGDRYTDGSWRVYRSGNDLEFQRRESGAWTKKGEVQA